MQDLENFKKEELTIDLTKANWFSLLFLIPIALLFGLPFYLIWGAGFSTIQLISHLTPQNYVLGLLVLLGVFILGIIIHELLHGLTWAIFSKNGFKSMKFGVFWKTLTPYCHCKEPLTVKHYIFGALAPCVILGILPAIIAFITGSPGLMLFGMVFTLAACGDIMIVYLLRHENRSDLVQDHPSAAGCYIYRKIE